MGYWDPWPDEFRWNWCNSVYWLYCLCWIRISDLKVYRDLSLLFHHINMFFLISFGPFLQSFFHGGAIWPKSSRQHGFLIASFNVIGFTPSRMGSQIGEFGNYRCPRLQWHPRDQAKVSLKADVTLTTYTIPCYRKTRLTEDVTI